MAAPSLEKHQRYVRINFLGNDGARAPADYHWIWLRHNCPNCVHPKTKERTVDPYDLAAQLEPTVAEIKGEQLHLVWEDGHQSDFELGWLAQHRYGAAGTPPGSDPLKVTLDSKSFSSVDALRAAALELVDQHRLVVVRNFGLETEDIVQSFERGGLPLIETHFGRIEDLRTDNTTNQNTDQLGYTDALIGLHTDQPFLDTPPRYQLLHCMRPADVGGENYLVDAKAAAEYLRSIDRDAFEALSTMVVRFHRKQKAFERIVDAPILEMNAQGELTQVRHSYFTFAPFAFSFAETERFYRAYRAFGELMNDRRYQYWVELSAGDFVLYDNRLALHARKGFEGARWMRGVYFGESTATPNPAV